MMRMTIILLACFASSCVSTPENLEGKRFDADFNYCRQLLRDTAAVVQHNPQTPYTSTASRFVSQADRDASQRAYNIDCESRSAFNARTREQE